MSIAASHPASHRADPQVPTMISVRVAAVSAGLLVALTGGVLAANVPAVGPATTVHQQPA
jgi:hypothetical protein